MGKTKVIDLNTAKGFMDGTLEVDLSVAKNITNEAAEILANYSGYLELNNLQQISDSVAKSQRRFIDIKNVDVIKCEET